MNNSEWLSEDTDRNQQKYVPIDKDDNPSTRVIQFTRAEENATRYDNVIGTSSLADERTNNEYNSSFSFIDNDNKSFLVSQNFSNEIDPISDNVSVLFNDSLSQFWSTTTPNMTMSNIHVNVTSNILSATNSSNVTDLPEQNRKVYWAIALLILPVLTVFGNLLVILSVYKERSLKTVTNYFIVSLAFADLLVAVAVMPFAVYVLVNVDWELSETLCDMYIAVDVACSTASILNLAAISVDRYIAVTQPLKYSKHKGNTTRVWITIAAVWVVSAVIATPIVLGLNTSPERKSSLCIFYNSDFIIYSSLGSFYIPCIVMIFLYYQIFKAIRERTKKSNAIKKPKLNDVKPQSTVIENTPQLSKLQQETTLSMMPVPLEKSAQLDSQSSPKITTTGSPEDEDKDSKVIQKMTSDVDTCQIIPNNTPVNLHPGLDTHDGSNQSIDKVSASIDKETLNKDNSVESNKKQLRLSSTANSSNKSAQTGGTAAAIDKKKKKSRFALSMVHKSSRKKKREKSAARRERKATKTLAIVLAIFLLCWVPFFTCNVINAICLKLNHTECQNVELFMATTWLGYINSCLNPLIYTIFNIEFRRAFKKILQEPCR